VRRERLIGIATDGHPTLLAVLVRIVERPHHTVVVDRPLVPAHQVGQADAEGITQALSESTALLPAYTPPQHFSWRGRSYRFAKMVDVRPRTTIDTVPNQFLCYLMRRYRRALRDLAPGPDIDRIVARIDGVLGAFQGIGHLQTLALGHPVLQHDPLYRRVLHAHLQLSRVLAMQGEV
jgi:hypothetical protein